MDQFLSLEKQIGRIYSVLSLLKARRLPKHYHHTTPTVTLLHDDMTTEHTTLAALTKAVLNRRPGPGLIFHSDRGSQYSSTLFCDELAVLGAVQSMSGRGDFRDNAVAESIFKTIKTECIYRYNFETPQ
jgi:transposase InsO family protein